MSNHTKGYCRDNAILSVLKEWHVLNSEQLKLLFFKNVSLRMAQKRLSRLTAMGKVQRQRDYMCQPYYYYLEQSLGQISHRIGVNWIRMWLLQGINSWGDTLYHWQYEPNYNTVRPDGFVGMKNTFTGKKRFYFIERECDTNPFKKVKLYNDLFASGDCDGAWWAEMSGGKFPAIIIIVESPARMDRVKKLIEKGNKHGLEFKVYLLDQIISEVKGANV